VATTAGLKAGHGQPVFVVGTARPVGSKAIGTAPTLQSAVDLIGSLAEEAHDIGAAYDDVADKLEAGEEVVAKGFEAETVDELQTAFAQRTSAVYSMIEEMLLLVWRHLLYYSKDAGGENVVPDRLSLSFSTANASTAPGATGGKDLQRVQASLRGVLERIDDVDPTGAASKISSDPYHNMLVRRLRELCASAVGE
jgi:nuclear pore complex protein Nup205